MSSHVFAYRCNGARTRRTDKSRSFSGREGGPGMTVFLAADERCHWECEGPHEIVNFFLGVKFTGHLAAEIFGVDGETVQFQDGAFHYDEQGARLGRMVEEQLRGPGPISMLELDSWAQLIGLHVLRRYSSISDKVAPRMLGGLAPAKLRTAVDYMQAHLASPLRLVEIAASVGMSQFAFARAFRRATGTSPHQYLTKLRVRAGARAPCIGKPAPKSHRKHFGFFRPESHDHPVSEIARNHSCQLPQRAQKLDRVTSGPRGQPHGEFLEADLARRLFQASFFGPD